MSRPDPTLLLIRPPRGRAPRHGGFTLVEVLVVVGVVAVLLSLLLPTLSSARRSARQAMCAANLRQWGIAANLYAAHHDNYLPRRGQGVQPTVQINRPDDWFNALPVELDAPPYQQLVAENHVPRLGEGSLWICSEAPDVTSGYLFTYGMNMQLSTWLGPLPDRIDRVGNNSTMVFMADAPSGYCSVLPADAPYSPVARHNGRVNIAFLDGHVASLTGTDVGCGVGDPLREDIRWTVPDSPWAGPSH